MTEAELGIKVIRCRKTDLWIMNPDVSREAMLLAAIFGNEARVHRNGYVEVSMPRNETIKGKLQKGADELERELIEIGLYQ